MSLFSKKRKPVSHMTGETDHHHNSGSNGPSSMMEETVSGGGRHPHHPLPPIPTNGHHSMPSTPSRHQHQQQSQHSAPGGNSSAASSAAAAAKVTQPKLVFHCQQAHGSPTGLISGFTNVKELYEKIAECYDIQPSEVWWVTLSGRRAIFELTFSLLFCCATRNHNYLLYLISRAVIAAAYLLADVTGKSYLPYIYFLTVYGCLITLVISSVLSS